MKFLYLHRRPILIISIPDFTNTFINLVTITTHWDPFLFWKQTTHISLHDEVTWITNEVTSITILLILVNVRNSLFQKQKIINISVFNMRKSYKDLEIITDNLGEKVTPF